MNKVKITTAAATLVVAVLIGAPAASAAPACSWFGDKESDPGSQGICNGGIDLGQSIQNAGKNLVGNLTLTGNLNLNNLGYALTHGVGSQG